ncbi:hypothetical protein [Desulfobacter hydrogenophilus]|uniref:hypothetical protein n=1 Tax=Desulfobacter hydrogenophilus TaxID=2291 RepID=UPI001F5EAA5F|nr:hypothetical protein [Desulfobacter hydrogenophilus]
MIAKALLKIFVEKHPEIKIEAIVADALYGNAEFMDEASKIAGNAQVISQIRYNQNILLKSDKNQLKHILKIFNQFKRPYMYVEVKRLLYSLKVPEYMCVLIRKKKDLSLQ